MNNRKYLFIALGLAILLVVVLTGCENEPPPSPVPVAEISATHPDSGNREQQETVTISGTNLSGVTKLSFGKGIAVNSFSVDNDNQITAAITISNDAELGTRDISVITPKEMAVLYEAFTVNDALPILDLSSSAIDLAIMRGDSSLPSGKLSIRNSGGGTLNWSAASERAWLEVSPASGSTGRQTQEVTLSLKLTTGMLAYAPYRTIIHISAKDALNSPQDVQVTFRVTENPLYIYGQKGVINKSNGKPVELKDNPRATNQTYAELMKFIAAETTDRLPFVSKTDALINGAKPFDCLDFAETVHNNAESAGIRAAVVTIDFEKTSEVYTINAFETSDKGLVFIDCTGESEFSQLDELTPRKPRMSWDKVAYVEAGKKYGTIPVDKATSLSYTFYEEYSQKWQKYKDLLKTYNLELEQYNKDALRASLMTSAEATKFSEQFYKLKDMEKTLTALRDGFGEAEFKPLDIVKNFTIYWSGGKQK